MHQHPIHSYLTPSPSEAQLPLGFTAVRVAVGQGLPAQLAVPGLGLSLLLSAPTARIRAWLDADPSETAAQSGPQLTPFPTVPRNDDPRAELAPVIIVSQGKSPVAIMPLVVNARCILPRAGQRSGTAIELLVRSFLLTNAAMVGPEAGPSFVELIWRDIAKGTDAFMAPVARPELRKRLTATTGIGADKARRAVSAELYTDAGRDAVGQSNRGGINWRLTHD